MNYIELKLFAEKEDAEMLTAALEERIPGGFSVEDPKDFSDLMNKEHSYDWDYVADSVKPSHPDRIVFTIWLEDSKEGLEQMEAILSDAEYNGVEESTVSNHSDDEWKDNWKAYFKPKKVAKTIVVKPTWENYTPLEGDKVIEIDPGQAFGTGTHETTSLCIRALEEYIPKAAAESGKALHGVTVLDVGAGSGILSIAAALLMGLGQERNATEVNGKSVRGIEIDPVAVEVAKENVALNRLSDVISMEEGDLTKDLAESEKYDIVVANLMADLVILLSGAVKKHILPGGYYISSGILVEKRELVRKAVEEAGFTIVDIPVDGEWCCIIAKA